jgi:hypothetical protein
MLGLNFDELVEAITKQSDGHKADKVSHIFFSHHWFDDFDNSLRDGPVDGYTSVSLSQPDGICH